MQVSLDATRILHLILLIALTIAGGRLFSYYFDWNGLAAYGTACTIVCQMSNVAMKFANGELDFNSLLLGDPEESTTKEKKQSKGGNPKKKRK